MAPFADLAEMTRMWAVEKYAGHWDGYSGEASHGGVPLPNNYYLYSDKLGQFQMLPWGTDQTWDRNLAFEGKAGLLFDKCLADESCAAVYGKRCATVAAAAASTSPRRPRRSTPAPWQELEQAGRYPHPLPARRRDRGRRSPPPASAEAEGWLADHP